MLSSCSLPTMKYCGDAVRKESLTEYAYFIFCNCLPTPTEKRQEGSVKLLRKRFPDLHKLISHDLAACLTKNVLVYGPSHKQEFSMSDLETALNQFCSRNGYDDLPYTAAANSIASQFKRIGYNRGSRGRAVASCGEVMETALIDSSESGLGVGFEATQESEQLSNEQIPEFNFPDNVSQDSFTYTDTSFGSGEKDLREEDVTPTSKPHRVVTYDADLSSETDAHTSSTIQHESCKKKHTELKRINSVRKQTVTISMPQSVGPDSHGPDRIFKIVMLGNSGVGKSSIVSALVLGNARYALATIGVDMVVKTFMVQGVKVSLQIWDTAGEERFHSMAPSYIRKADAVVLVYDISDHTSFVDVPLYWIPFIRKHLTGDNVSLLLLGNKIDKSAQRVISGEDGSVLARDGGMVFREVSSRDSDTICSVYHSLSQTLVANENAELDRFSQLTLTVRRQQANLSDSPDHGSSCVC